MVHNAAKRAGVADSEERVVMIGGSLSDEEWATIGDSIDAKISGLRSSDTPRRERLRTVCAVELRTAADVDRLLQPDPHLTPLDIYRKQFDGVPGWFRLPAIALWDSLLTFQSTNGVRGNFLEIGVWKGRSALLSALHSAEGEECVHVDLLPSEEARANLKRVRQSGLHFFNTTSRTLAPEILPGSGAPGYRWIHIDGEHTGIAVEKDLTLASSLLGPRGIIVVDDFFSHEYPQITFAVIEHLKAHPKTLMMFLCGYSKAYLCHPSDGVWLLQYVAERLAADLEERGAPPFTLFKTTDPLDLNAFGIGPRSDGLLFRGPDDDKALLRF